MRRGDTRSAPGRTTISEPAATSDGGSFFRRKWDDSRERPAPASGLEPGRVLGEGGMGQVWEAVQISLRRRVARKLMPSGRLLSETALAMFEREARAGGRLHHPSIVSVLAYGEADGVPPVPSFPGLAPRDRASLLATCGSVPSRARR